MKVQVFIRSFGAPILLAVLLIIWLIYGMTPFQIFVQTVFVISFAILKLLSEEKYIQTFFIHEEQVSISYYTPFLNLKEVEFGVSDIREIKLGKRSGLSVIWPPILDVKLDRERNGFTILSKELYNEIQLQLQKDNVLLKNIH